MIKTQKLIYLRVNPVEGQNKDTGKDFAFANVVLSDGLESIELPLDFDLVPQCKQFSKGDNVHMELELVKKGYNYQVKIIKINKVA